MCVGISGNLYSCKCPAHAETIAPQSGFYDGTGFVNVYRKLESFEKGDDESILLLDKDNNVKYIKEAHAYNR